MYFQYKKQLILTSKYKEVNSIVPSPSVRIPWFVLTKVSGARMGRTFFLAIFCRGQERLDSNPRADDLFYQGILNGEVSLYHWPPVWLVWISLFCKYKQKLSVFIQLIPNQSNRRSMVQWYFPLWYSLVLPTVPLPLATNGTYLTGCPPRYSTLWVNYALLVNIRLPRKEKHSSLLCPKR